MSSSDRIAAIRDTTSGGATMNPTRRPGASTFDSVPMYTTTRAGSALANGSTGRPS